jgi:hypothetical protein
MSIGVLLIMFLQYLGPRGQSCSAVLAQDNRSLRKFLVEQMVARDSPCISPAIKRLGRARDAEAGATLVAYLDYLDPATAPRPGGGADVRPYYPAVSALFQIGKPAASGLLSAIQAGESPATRENAVKAYEYVYRDELWSGIRELRKTRSLAKTDEERRRLNKALQKLINECNARDEKEAQACRYAAAG